MSWAVEVDTGDTAEHVQPSTQYITQPSRPVPVHQLTDGGSQLTLITLRGTVRSVVISQLTAADLL